MTVVTDIVVFNDTATTEIYTYVPTLSLPDALPICGVFRTVTEGARRLEAGGSREKQHGRVVIIGSITADKIFPATAVYGATKAAVRHMGKALAREWARRGLNVNILQPGYLDRKSTRLNSSHKCATRMSSSA